MKNITIVSSLFALCLFFVSPSMADTTYQGTINWLNGTPFGTWAFLGSTTTTVGQIPFKVNASGYVEIDLLSVELRDADMGNQDINGDGEIAYIDPYIYVFKDDGSLVAENDDAWGTQGVADGSISGRDSFWSGYLEAGNYVLSVGDYELSQNDAATETNYNSFGPFGSGDSVVTDHGDYQVTFTGDITILSEEIPTDEPQIIKATIDVHPETLNVKSKGKFVHCVITMPDDYDVQDIATDSVTLTKINESTLKAPLNTTRPSEIGHYDGKPGVRLLKVKFDRKTLIDFIGTAEGKVSLSVRGTMQDGSTIFEGTDVIRVINGK
jgi:hypothetical protein